MLRNLLHTTPQFEACLRWNAHQTAVGSCELVALARRFPLRKIRIRCIEVLPLSRKVFAPNHGGKQSPGFALPICAFPEFGGLLPYHQTRMRPGHMQCQARDIRSTALRPNELTPLTPSLRPFDEFTVNKLRVAPGAISKAEPQSKGQTHANTSIPLSVNQMLHQCSTNTRFVKPRILKKWRLTPPRDSLQIKYPNRLRFGLRRRLSRTSPSGEAEELPGCTSSRPRELLSRSFLISGTHRLRFFLAQGLAAGEEPRVRRSFLDRRIEGCFFPGATYEVRDDYRPRH